MSFNFLATSQIKGLLNMSSLAEGDTSERKNSVDSNREPINGNFCDELLLPNNSSVKINELFGDSLVTINVPKVAEEGRESTNPYFTKIEKMIDFQWEMVENSNLLAIHPSKPIVAYVINRNVRPFGIKLASPNANPPPESNPSSQVVRIMNYETKQRCLAKAPFRSKIMDIAFAINSITAKNDNLLKLAIADKGGNVCVFEIFKRGDEVFAILINEIINDDILDFSHVKLAWCPYVPSDDDEDDNVNDDPGLKLALSSDNSVEVFALDIIRHRLKNEVSRSMLKGFHAGYQLIHNIHTKPIVSLSISNDLTAICTSGQDNTVKFHGILLKERDFDEPSKLIYDWSPPYLKDDQISNFYFLDDFTYLLSNTNQNFWGHALIGTKNGHLSIVDLKDWQCLQSVKLNAETEKNESFIYKIDLTAHFVAAVKGNLAFLIHLHLPHDKRESDEEEDLNFAGVVHPRIVKISRFQIYNAPLLSFAVNKVSSTEVNVYWITNKTLEKCNVDLTAMREEEDLFETSQILSPIKPNLLNYSKAASTNANTSINSMDVEVLNSSQREELCQVSNGYETNPAELSFNKPEAGMHSSVPRQSSFGSTGMEDALAALKMQIGLPSHSLQALPPPVSREHSYRAESPTSAEVQNILDPTSAIKSMLSISNSSAVQQDICISNNNYSEQLPGAIAPTQPMNIPINLLSDMNTLPSQSLPPASSVFAQFESMLPKDFAKEEQLRHFEERLHNEIDTCKLQVVERCDKLENDLIFKMNGKFVILQEDLKAQKLTFQNEVKKMKEDLKLSMKNRNDEFNKNVEKVVNRLMHELNVLVQKGFNDLMNQVQNDVKLVTSDMSKAVSEIQKQQQDHMQAIQKQQEELLAIQKQIRTIQPSPNTVKGLQLLPAAQGSAFQQMPSQSPHSWQSRRTPNATQSVPSTPVPVQNPIQMLMQGEQMFHQQEHSAMNDHLQKLHQQHQQHLLQQQRDLEKLQQQQQQKQQQEKAKKDIIRLVSDGKIGLAITQALNLSNPQLVSQICEMYEDSPQRVVNAIEKEQTALVSLLHQLTLNDFTEEPWKTLYIELIITRLDLQDEMVKKILPTMTKTLIQRLDAIMKRGGAYAERARVLSFTFKCM